MLRKLSLSSYCKVNNRCSGLLSIRGCVYWQCFIPFVTWMGLLTVFHTVCCLFKWKKIPKRTKSTFFSIQIYENWNTRISVVLEGYECFIIYGVFFYTPRKICHGNNIEYILEDQYHFLFSSILECNDNYSILITGTILSGAR